jgi:hypothetical protein
MGFPLFHISRVDRTSAGGSPYGDGGAFLVQRVKSGGIPVRKADTAMASGAADGIGDGAAVDADTGTVQSGPEDAGGCWGRGKVWKSSVCSPRGRRHTRQWRRRGKNRRDAKHFATIRQTYEENP